MGRGQRVVVALIVAVAALVGVPAGASAAATKPAAQMIAAPGDTDDEGGSKSLREALESASKAHIEAQQKLDASKKRQLALDLTLKQNEAELTDLLAQVGTLADHSYRRGRLSGMALLLNAGTPDDFMARTMSLDTLSALDAKKISELVVTKGEVSRAKAAIDAEVKEQAKQVAVQAKKKKDAERALAAAGGGGPGTDLVSADSPNAQPAPRNSDGSWPKESCSVSDPTTSGCITPRTLHAMNQARSDGFKRYRSCYRSGGGGEHPKGRACDFAAATGGFENVNATGGDKAYGDRLAAYLVKNASRLGVLYVIWYRQIWMPGNGWSRYSGSGSPAATHTNHVHLSMI